MIQGGKAMNIVYGYCRCSKPKQVITRQIMNIQKDYPNAVLYKEYFTGTTNDRPKWNKLKNLAKDGDTIVFDSVSRMSRNSEEGFADYKDLYLRGVKLVFLNEPHINTDVFKKSSKNLILIDINSGNKAVDDYFKGNINLINKLLLDLAEQQIKIAFEQSEKEVEDLHSRISSALRARAAEGKPLGLQKGVKLVTKKSINAKKIIRENHADFDGTLTNDETVRKIVGCSRNSYFKYKRELKEELNYGGATPYYEIDEEFYSEVFKYAVEQGSISTSDIQRKFSVGFVKASAIFNRLTEDNPQWELSKNKLIIG